MAAEAGARSSTSYPPVHAPRDREGFDWLTQGRTLWRHKLFLASFVAAALGLTAVYDARAPSTFEAETLVVLGEPEVRAETAQALSAVRVEDSLQRELLEFRSPDMAERLVDQLSLHLRPEFNPELDYGSVPMLGGINLVRLVPAALIDRLPSGLVDAFAPGVAVSDQQHAEALRAEIVERVRARIIAEPADRLGVISVRFASSDPQLAALGANRLAALYLARQAEAEQVDALKTRAFLEQEIARLRAAIAQANIQSVKRWVARGGAANDAFEALELASQADLALLEIYSNRVRDMASRENEQEPPAKIISEAITPDQTTDPRHEAIFGVVLFCALLIGSFAALGIDRLDDTFRNAERLEDLVGLRILAVIPSIPDGSGWQKAPDRHILDYPSSPFGVAVAGLRTAILRTARGGQRKTILLTSARANEGKSVLAVSLARIHARFGARVLLVDCDLRRPHAQDPAGVDEPGLGDVLLGRQPLEGVVHRDERSGAFLVAAGAAVPDMAILASETMHRLLRDAADAYDLVILDGSPVLDGSDACILAQLADRTLFLVHWGSTCRQDVVAATKLLIQAGADMAGTVLTRADIKKRLHATPNFACDPHDQGPRRRPTTSERWHRIRGRTAP